MVRDYKKDILSVETFLDNRPDMSVHSEQSIQSAIYSAASLLNGETNGNIEVVWNYNHGGDRQQSDPRYRNDYELNQIVEAFIVQTQYTLNIGNDYSVGGGSYSIGNINSSFSRPIDRDILAPGVVRLLQNARVYQAQSYFSSGEQKDCGSCVDYDADCITRNIGDMRYVRKEQQANLMGYIATIDDNGFVMFAKPSYIGIPENVQSQLDSLKLGVSTNKQNIDKAGEAIGVIVSQQLEDEAKINQNTSDIATLKPKVEKNTGDIIQIRNQHASDTTAINNRFGNVEGKIETLENALKEGRILHFETENAEWQANHSYSMGALATDGGKTYYSKVNQNLNNQPSTSPEYWQLFTDTTINMSDYPTKQEVLGMLDNYLKLNDFETRIANYYTKDETNDLLDEKANTSDLDEYTLHEEFLNSQKRQDDKIKEVESKVNAIQTGKIEGVKVATFSISAPIQTKEVVGVDYSELDSKYARLDTNNTYNNGVRNIFRTLPEVYTQSTLPTKPVELTTKRYVDDNFLQVSTQSGIGKQVDSRLNINGLLSMRGGNDIELTDSSGDYKSLHKSGDKLQWGGQNLATERYVIDNTRPNTKAAGFRFGTNQSITLAPNSYGRIDFKLTGITPLEWLNTNATEFRDALYNGRLVLGCPRLRINGQYSSFGFIDKMYCDGSGWLYMWVRNNSDSEKTYNFNEYEQYYFTMILN